MMIAEIGDATSPERSRCASTQDWLVFFASTFIWNWLFLFALIDRFPFLLKRFQAFFDVFRGEIEFSEVKPGEVSTVRLPHP